MGIAVNEDFGKISKGMTFKVKVLLVPIYNSFRFFPHPSSLHPVPKFPNILDA